MNENRADRRRWFKEHHKQLDITWQEYNNRIIKRRPIINKPIGFK